MQYIRRIPNGICTYYVIRIKGITKVFGIVITRAKKILFYHEQDNEQFKSTFIIKNREVELALC